MNAPIRPASEASRMRERWLDSEPVEGEGAPSLDEQAMLWVVRLSSGDSSAEMIAEYEAWRALDPAHAAAMQEARRLWLGIGQVLPGLGKSATPKPTPVAAKARPRGALAAVAAALVVSVVAAVWWSNDRYDAVTATGETRTITLPDGSSMQLGTDTAANFRFRGSERHVDLARGEAYFDVAHDETRPFVIDAGTGHVRVLGTAFSVRRDGEAVTVTVTRGRVEVSGGALEPVQLTLGEQVKFSPRDHGEVAMVNTDQVLAWRRGQLQFEDQSLRSVLEEVGRYDHRLWLVDDSVATRTRMNAVVSADKIDPWLDALTQSMPITVTRVGPVVWVRESKGTAAAQANGQTPASITKLAASNRR
jgi:transmembrane sensor